MVLYVFLYISVFPLKFALKWDEFQIFQAETRKTTRSKDRPKNRLGPSKHPKTNPYHHQSTRDMIHFIQILRGAGAARCVSVSSSELACWVRGPGPDLTPESTGFAQSLMDGNHEEILKMGGKNGGLMVF